MGMTWMVRILVVATAVAGLIGLVLAAGADYIG